MNFEHLRAFCWLRWRLLANQVTKGGILNQIILVLTLIGSVVGAVVAFAGGIVVGAVAFALPNIPPWAMLLTWDVLILLFLFGWSIGLLSELQRSEALSIDKFLHLPVSLTGVFVLNYFSSLLSVNLLFFAPMLLGFTFGLVVSKGPAMLLVLPALAAFFLMVTGLTYQFQGWLASLMANKRRRRTIVVLITAAFVLLFQIPNLFNLYVLRWNGDQSDSLLEQEAKLHRDLKTKKITPQEFGRKTQEIARAQNKEQQQRNREFREQAQNVMWIGSIALPPGWLALGAASAAEGNVLPAVLGTLGMGLIGAASLWRAYRTTLRLYTGQFTAGKTAPSPQTSPRPKLSGAPAPATLLETNIRWLSEPAAVIALATFRSLTRAPEAKMLLLSPILMVVIFGGIFWQSRPQIPDLVRPMLAFGAMTMIFFALTGILSNQFGFDRAGFKIYVLSPALRRDILLGKNLALLPFIVALSAPIIVVIEILAPMPISYLLAVPFEFVSLFLIASALANVLSIIAPMAVASGTMRAANPKLIPVLLQMATALLLPLLFSPVLLPWGVQAGLEALEITDGVPICLLLSALECAALAALYRWVLGLEGRLLQYRELKILETVTTKTE